MSHVTINPASSLPTCLKSLNAPLQCLWTHGTEGRVTQSGLFRLSELERVAFVVSPAAQVDRLPLSCDFLHTEHVPKKPQTFFGLGSEQLNMSKMSNIKDWFLYVIHRNSILSSSFVFLRQLTTIESQSGERSQGRVAH